ncbi:TPA: DUF4209 domain-containing protein [Pseudomonas aeruginosa]|uniref:DUF4209 domain-containing protein n=1 Tax=Stutzerimonas stutzeri TaxID=316 RepID=A0ABD4XY95_STUST|nr:MULTISPECIES: DUF4209 domain-containing protein [Pseudomonadaceae]MDH0687242.1 DUF4209 domain-containing protein [Stutzerimonas stutzeri]MDH2200747.1 DUF4209 domain-containing protein [Pseudomonas oleovorans]HCE5838035.1 DUF4209 domain-containing protein [Pseudomonas aeruginosa]HCE9265611.1 DUF4209 domain-containing protein [Pseudomonas aeruginosa]HDU8750398.1 DUF4209 domain-containing protein [Pseudomonas aeruginosa]
MTQQRYPADLPVTLEDVQGCGWKEVLQGIAEEDFGYSALWSAFSKAAGSAMEAGRQKHAKVLWLLADACSMMLHPNSLTEPFKPFAVFQDRRSALPEDFTAEDLSLFRSVMEFVDDPLLKARLADLLWLVGSPRDIKHALAAIDAYRVLPLSPNTWSRGSQECWERGVVLAQMVGKGGGDRLATLQQRVVDALKASTEGDGFFGVKLARMLRNHRLARVDGGGIAQKLEAIARALDDQGDVFGARAFYEESAHWFRWLGQQEKHAEMTVAQAETYVREAAFQSVNALPSNMIANSLYEKAIQIYRDIPGKWRPTYRVDERIAELRRQQSQAGEQVLDEMGVIRSPSMDITEFVEQSRKLVSGKPALDALNMLANIHPGERVAALRETVIERMRQFPLQWIFESTTFSRDGRVIAKRPALNLLATELSTNDERTIQAAMVRDYAMFLGITVQGAILPALEALRLEHRIRKADFIELAQHSPIVPSGRGVLFGKALFAGYDGDFEAALHLLIPQVEHMVRTHLKQAGASTTTLDKEGIENENGLSTLMALPEAEEVFGDDMAFELKALFCDPFGPNLRNELAHGLLDDAACRSAASVYAWWLGLRLVFNTWWNARAATVEGEEQAGQKSESTTDA